jgi:hypothetical protein
MSMAGFYSFDLPSTFAHWLPRPKDKGPPAPGRLSPTAPSAPGHQDAGVYGGDLAEEGMRSADGLAYG